MEQIEEANDRLALSIGQVLAQPFQLTIIHGPLGARLEDNFEHLKCLLGLLLITIEA